MLMTCRCEVGFNFNVMEIDIMNYKLIDSESNLSEDQVSNSVYYLRRAFMNAWWEYRERNPNAVLNFIRNPKTLKPIIYKGDDLTVYEAQVEFAYLIDEIQRGPIFDVSNPIRRCNELIDSISPAV